MFHDRMLEDTNSLDAAHMRAPVYTIVLYYIDLQKVYTYAEGRKLQTSVNNNMLSEDLKMNESLFYGEKCLFLLLLI